jgi:hypothetical protein
MTKREVDEPAKRLFDRNASVAFLARVDCHLAALKTDEARSHSGRMVAQRAQKGRPECQAGCPWISRTTAASAQGRDSVSGAL